MSLRLITTLRNYAADITRQSIDGDVPLPKGALMNIVDALKEAAQTLEQTVAVKPEELRGMSFATALLLDALDSMDAGLSCRETVVDARRRVLQALESVNERDTSWH